MKRQEEEKKQGPEMTLKEKWEDLQKNPDLYYARQQQVYG
jgi:hypothetical protein